MSPNETLKEALACVASVRPYQCYGITRTALWEGWLIEINDRLYDYKKRLAADKINKQRREKIDLKFALTLTLFKSDSITEALKSMYVYGYRWEIIPSEYREDLYLEDPSYHNDACYRVLFYIFAKYTPAASDNDFKREKMRVTRMIEAREYICKNEPHLYTFFFGESSKN